MRENFRQHLEHLKSQLMEMAVLVDRATGDAVQAYLHKDTELAAAAISAEVEIDRMEREVDRNAIELLAMEQPTAIDLRFILSVMRINSDLERIGDQASNIAHRLQDIYKLETVSLPVDIAALSAHARRMLNEAMSSFQAGDSERAEAVLAMDDEIDEMTRRAFTSLSEVISDRPSDAPQALNALLVSRILERIADHATNVAEDVIFWQRASDVRHTLPNF